jgi:hypothetical protein
MSESADGSIYEVTYATPIGELGLLGMRGVVVDVTTGNVEFFMRE